MSEGNWCRRRFLQSLPAGVAAAGVLESLMQARAGFARSLEALPQEPSPDWAALRAQYSLAEGITYFNHGSIGTIPIPLQQARQKYLALCESNPWLYMWETPWEAPRQQTRRKAAQLMGCGPDEVALTHNTTEGFNLLAAGLPLGAGDEVLFSSLNHPGASICWEHHGASRGYKVRRFQFPVQQIPSMGKEELLDAYDRHITRRTRVLAFPHIDNMVGLRHPIKDLSALARSKGVEFVAVDGAQSLGMIPVELQGSGVDFYACSPHKWLQAPKGLGLLYVRKQVQRQLRPMWVTWGQQRWKGTVRIFEDYGTRNLAEVLVLGDAIDFQAKLGIRAKQARYRSLREHFRRRVEESPDLVWLSPARWEMGASLYSIQLRGKASRQVFQALYSQRGMVFRAFGGSDFDAMRLSLNLFNRREEIDRFVEATR
ncbi:MAG: aminotransferase class V-fold PLP-dependent enzyme, partial [Acidobacteriota bacterium]